MSTRSTIIHTKEQEHWFFDSSEVLNKPTDPRKNAISIEFSKKNVRIDSVEGEESVCLTITNCESEIYKLFEELSKIVWRRENEDAVIISLFNEAYAKTGDINESLKHVWRTKKPM